MESLTVGVTGHRPDRLGGVDLAALAEQVCAALKAFAAAAGAGRPLRLVSNLAEGADSIAFDQAADLGWALDVVLPFAPRRNAEDFPDPAALAGLDERLGRADAVFALAWHGEDAETPAIAYERAGRVMLARSDVLLAIWDGDRARGRGGAAQIIAEAVEQGIPVLHVDARLAAPTMLLWDRLDEHHWGVRQLATVPRGGLDRLPRLIDHLVADEAGAVLPVPDPRRRPTLAIAYPLLLMVAGVRRLRWSDFWRVRVDTSPDALIGADGRAAGDARGAFARRVGEIVASGYGVADAAATEAGRRYRSAYVSNFSLAALAVLVSLAGLALPSTWRGGKPLLVAIEFGIASTILIVTRLGNRSGWHRQWLDARRIAEQLRCLATAAQLGDLRLRDDPHPVTRAIARRLGLPDAMADRAYLAGVHADLVRLIDGQIDYLEADAGRTHRLEHRLHRFGGLLFGATAALCLVFLLIEIGAQFSHALHDVVDRVVVWGTIGGTALPAIGAAIYGIRMQGDFAGTAERNEALVARLRRIRALSDDAAGSYDALHRCVSQVAELLTQDLSTWLHTYSARPLVLPG